ncbi:hypothetical protein GE061_019165 [Apolygus lucorum]|uniref:Uncharacterized protein n=1 Tax=Apolygus lucorum TaxID=248454 RepID=A0A6A4JP75_APOLU|nr:hypothetical protein GE061_019165 [Apolygus lucorum]
MAIPFNLPSDEETEDAYRRIDQLLLDLYDLLRQIILRQRPVQNERGVSEARISPTWDEQAASMATQTVETTRLESRLPDLIADTLPSLVANTRQSLPLVRKSSLVPQRRRRRRAEKPLRRYARIQTTPYDDLRAPPQPVAASSWLNVGIELRQIAEEITFISRNGNSSTAKRRSEIKASSLFSLLVPAPVTGTFWTTVIILVGWRILSKQR